jgi:hypothetical protein
MATLMYHEGDGVRMEERVGDEPEDQRAHARRLKAESRARVADALGRLKALDARWASEHDSETLWQEEHAVLLVLSGELELRPVLKRAKLGNRARSGDASPKELADGALGLWALDRLDESAEVLRIAVDRLPDNRYPWDLLLRHASMRGADEGIAFITSSLPRIAWRGYALTQLGARHLDAASKALSGRDPEGCRARLAEARKALEGARGERDLTDEMRANGDRLLTLVERLEKRLAEGKNATSNRALERIFGQVPGEQTKLEGQVRTVAEVAGVNLEGESDPTLDLDEVERVALKEQSAEDRESTVTVIRVTPVLRSAGDAKKEKGEAQPQDRIEEA